MKNNANAHEAPAQETAQTAELETVKNFDEILQSFQDPNSEFEPVMNKEAFSFSNLETKGEFLEGVFLGDYKSFCEKANVTPKPKIKGYVFLNEFGIQIVGEYHALEKLLTSDKFGKKLRILRGEEVVKDGKTKYVNFHVFVKKQS